MASLSASSSGEGTAAAGGSSSHAPFQVPSRAIYTQEDLKAFHKSQTYADYLMFVRLLNEKVRGIAVEDKSYPVRPVVGRLVSMMDTLNDWVDETPPLQQPMRFGNQAFRTWHARLVQSSPAMIKELLPPEKEGAVSELQPYLTSGFGHQTRIDYGTGHESSFVIFLYCLFRLQDVLQQDDLVAVVLRVFRAYLRVMRRLQTVYMLEPAGSHGVWGLDDYHCLPFLWGSSQLVGHATILPSSIHSDDVLRESSGDYLYLSAIAFIKDLKKGVPFAESSPMLNDISGLPTWSKVNVGMLRLYEGEVLGKLPVIQHFLFGTLFPCTWTPTSPLASSEGQGDEAISRPKSPVATAAPWAAEHRQSSPPPPPPPSDGSGGVACRAPWAR